MSEEKKPDNPGELGVPLKRFVIPDGYRLQPISEFDAMEAYRLRTERMEAYHIKLKAVLNTAVKCVCCNGWPVSEMPAEMQELEKCLTKYGYIEQV